MNEVRTVCPRDCYDSCGMIAAISADGSARIRGDGEAHNRGRLCGKCSLYYNAADNPARLASPLRRTGPKGTFAFKPISWAEALGEMAAHLSATCARHPERVIHSHYDGTRGLLAREFPLRLMNTLGATTVDPSTICHSAAIKGLEYVFGKGAFTVDPREIDQAEVVVLWGNNPRVSAPQTYRAIRASPKRRVVFVNPLKLAGIGESDMQLRLRPGSDAMLCFAVMRLLLDQGGIDHAFVDRWTAGFDELRKVIEAVDLDEVVAATGLTLSQIAELTNLIRRHPTVIWIGMGVQRQAQGGNVARAVAMLPILTGNQFRPGAGLLYLNGMARHGLDKARVIRTSNPRDCRTIGHGLLPETLRDPRRSEIFITWNNNIAVSSPNSALMHEALSRKDLFYVQLEKRLTRSSLYADLILPAADYSEMDDIVYSYLHLTLSAQVAFRPPHGESLANQEIFRRLARRMGLDDPWLQEADRPILDDLVGAALPGKNFADLKRAGTVPMPYHENEVLPQALLAGGRIRIWSEAALADGAPATPLPVAETRALDFTLTSGGSPWRINSSLDDNPALRRKLRPDFHISRAVAARLGIASGDICELSNETGSIRRIAQVGDLVRDDQIFVEKCQDFGAESEFLLLNTLTDCRSSDMGNCVAFQSVSVNVRRISV